MYWLYLATMLRVKSRGNCVADTTLGCTVVNLLRWPSSVSARRCEEKKLCFVLFSSFLLTTGQITLNHVLLKRRLRCNAWTCILVVFYFIGVFHVKEAHCMRIWTQCHVRRFLCFWVTPDVARSLLP